MTTIQDTIADWLGGKIRSEMEHRRRAELSNLLKRKGRVLIIFEDLSKQLDLRTVGIPYDIGCKVIVISQFDRVCNQMETHKNVHIKNLEKQDALTLFKNKANGCDSTSGVEVEKAVEKAVEEAISQCNTSPKSIVARANAVRGKHPEDWTLAIQQELGFISLNIHENTANGVPGVTQGCHQLQSVEANPHSQIFFLVLACHNASMEKVGRCGLVDKSFPGLGTKGDVWGRTHSDKYSPKSSFLSLEGDGEGCFRVDDNTRKFGEDARDFFWMEEILEELPLRSLRPGLPALPVGDAHQFRNLTNLCLLFPQNNPLKDIPFGFFEEMTHLKCLTITSHFINDFPTLSLPSSIQRLKNLESLFVLHYSENIFSRVAPLPSGFIKPHSLVVQNYPLECTPLSFLEEMYALRYLDINGTFSLPLPSSIQCLEHLSLLILENIILEGTPLPSELNKLRRGFRPYIPLEDVPFSSHPACIPFVEAMLTSDFSALASSMAAVKDIMDEMKGETNNIIGVYEPGGINKTMLMKQLAKQAEKGFFKFKIDDENEHLRCTHSDKYSLKDILKDIACHNASMEKVGRYGSVDKSFPGLGTKGDVWGRTHSDKYSPKIIPQNNPLKCLTLNDSPILSLASSFQPLTSWFQLLRKLRILHVRDYSENIFSRVAPLPSGFIFSLPLPSSIQCFEHVSLLNLENIILEGTPLPSELNKFHRGFRQYIPLEDVPFSSHPACIPFVEAMPTSDFSALASSMAAVKDIMDEMKGETNNIIGVYELGGINKTTLMKQLAKQAEKGFFKFKIEDENEHLRCTRLFYGLKQKSNVLIILDDLWRRLHLGNVGILYGHDHKRYKPSVFCSVFICHSF